ncbi:carbonic anhydrase [Scleroderma yunnanense]
MSSSSSPLLPLLSANAQWAAEHTGSELFKQCAKGQSPKFLWIGCADSRVPESVVTDAKPGDNFVHRNIANQFHLDDDSALSVLTYAVNVLCVEHGGLWYICCLLSTHQLLRPVIVAGHTKCGGALACLQAAQSGTPTQVLATDTSLGRWLAPLTRLISTLDLASILSPAHLDSIVEANVKRQVENVCETSVIRNSWAAYIASGEGNNQGNDKDIKETKEMKQVWVHGWVYDVASGRIKDLGISRGPS